MRFFLNQGDILLRSALFYCLRLVVFNLWVGSVLHAAVGPQIFNYEVHAHQSLVPATNYATRNYGENEKEGRHAVIPPLTPHAHAVGISLMRHNPPLQLWQHEVSHLLGGPLNWQEACQMAIDRQAIGIQVNFQHQLAIAAMGAGAGVHLAAPLAGMAAVDFVNYLQNALRGGGYYAPQAAGLYRLRNNVPHPVFTVLAGVPNPPDCVILHFRNVMRVSKNLKELSHNARIVPPDGGGVVVYETIKNIINNQFFVLGLPEPSSATVVSADFLQPN